MKGKGKKANHNDSESSSDDETQKKSLLTKVQENKLNQIKPHLQEKTNFIPEPDTDETEDMPPYVVVVHGPKKSGKTTLIQSLVKHYTHHKISSAAGTITLRTGKRGRITLIECPNDIQSMIDLAKIADLCLLLIDASVGFEMETFEYLSILQSHGFPNVMGILTHLDFFKENKQKRNNRKSLKKRFAQEVGESYKLFYLSGIKNGYYIRLEIQNLARYISIIKCRQTAWKSGHSHVLVDRFELLGDEEYKDEEDEATVAMFGYVRGCSYRLNDMIHIVGLGDYKLKDIALLDDPCPPLMKGKFDLNEGESDDEGKDKDKGDMEEEGEAGGADDANKAGSKKKKKRRTLKQTERIIYAPQSNLGYLNYDKNSGYITIPDNHIMFTKIEEERVDEFGRKYKVVVNNEGGEGVQMVRKLQELEKGINEKLNEETEAFLLDGIKMDVGTDEEESVAAEDPHSKDFNQKKKEMKDLFESSVAASNKILEGQDNIVVTDVSKQIYDDIGLDFRGSTHAGLDCSHYRAAELKSREFYLKMVKRKFVTGANFLEEGMDEEDGEGENPQEEKGESKAPPRNPENGEEEDDDDEDEEDDSPEAKQRRAEKRRKAAEAEEQKKKEKEAKEKSVRDQLKDTLLNADYGVYKRGCYVKIEVSGIKIKHYKKFGPEIPLILARVNPAEDTFGFLKIRVKKHRWYTNLLKSNDPLIFSIGWRRFQSLPIFGLEETDSRLRMIKYTPQHDFCLAVFYGSFAPQDSGVICTQTVSSEVSKFRIAATGYVIELNYSYQLVKKLKLVGEPLRVFKNTALVKGMFNSKLEVAKFEGTPIKTVSGIRGQIKKAVNEGPDGTFRASFEDKILMSDIIFCRTWVNIQPEKYYNPLISFQDVRLMKTTWELRKEKQIDVPTNVDSEYKIVERKTRVFNPLLIPKKLEENLPFKSKEKIIKKSKHEKLIMNELKPLKSLTTDSEKEVYALIQRLNTIKNERKKAEKEKKAEKFELKQKMHFGERREMHERKKEYQKKKTKERYAKKVKKQ